MLWAWELARGVSGGGQPSTLVEFGGQVRHLLLRQPLPMLQGLDAGLPGTTSLGPAWTKQGILLMYKRILLAYDGSVEGRTALREGAILAKHAQARVYLLSIVSESSGLLAAEGAFAGVVDKEQETYRTILEDGVARLKELGLEPVAELRVGEPGREIASFAREIAADLVVVGHRRRSGLQRWWGAGAGVRLLDLLDCSLLIARQDISDSAWAATIETMGR